jgi:CheY-like chemotaxis protein
MGIGERSRDSGTVRGTERIDHAGQGIYTRLGEAIESVLTTAANFAASRGVSFDIRHVSPSPLVALDRTVLRQILLGIIVGAVAVTDSGQVVEVLVETANAWATVSISTVLASVDTSSILEDLDARLTVARQLAQPSNAMLQLSREGRTLRIWLSLPAVQSTTILVVDDNPGMLRLFRRFLSGGRYVVIEAQTSDDALRFAVERQPNAITLDVMMPSKDGWEVLQALRAQPLTRHIPVIVCSVLKERDLALSLGASAFLAKPITQDDLLRALAALEQLPGR